ncbi:CDP-diacylglycerol---serine O-phosphatidyltransferase [Sulfitobacter brevis]|uniref:CDP-diacylglycerol---serine O-phosphatidyltransferase n=1 Tax=Sulfitobacter brevis TaxID=74348 RepID=A0A1I1UH10_9RHOB|nr:phosphatidylcholine/phosphatidylserine synthase [Sulfitobacter brevis]SFD67220.1 CDP-diacylglycerol---serine O-phosphatidyltransferase [Sulfitobacter brevis]
MSEPREIKLRHIVPSLVTVFAICAGLTSVRMGLEGRLEFALSFILLAVFLDAADGKLARFLDTASPFGAELDTLADFFNFGIAPGILIYSSLYHGTPNANFGWLAVLVLAVCCALRLARFNLSLGEEKAALKKDNFFVGVPAPALACLALMPVFMHLSGWENADFPILRAFYIIGVGLLAVSTIPTFSIKHASIKRKHLAVVILLAVLMVISFMTYPWPTLVALNLLYLATLPLSYFAHRRLTQA